MSLTRVKHNGYWKEFQQPYGKHSGVWKPAKEIWAKSGGVWKQTWPDYLGFTLVPRNALSACGGAGATYRDTSQIGRVPRSDEDRYVFYCISGGNIEAGTVKINGAAATIGAAEIDGAWGSTQNHMVAYAKVNTGTTAQLDLAKNPTFANDIGMLYIRPFVVYIPKGESPRVNVKKKAISLQAGGNMQGTATLVTDHGLTTYLHNYFFGFVYRAYISDRLTDHSITGASSRIGGIFCPVSLYGTPSHAGQIYHSGYVQGSGKSGKTTAVIPSDLGSSGGGASFLFTVRVSSTKK